MTLKSGVVPGDTALTVMTPALLVNGVLVDVVESNATIQELADFKVTLSVP